VGESSPPPGGSAGSLPPGAPVRPRLGHPRGRPRTTARRPSARACTSAAEGRRPHCRPMPRDSPRATGGSTPPRAGDDPGYA